MRFNEQRYKRYFSKFHEDMRTVRIEDAWDAYAVVLKKLNICVDGPRAKISKKRRHIVAST